jgi:hypothetical protein
MNSRNLFGRLVAANRSLSFVVNFSNHFPWESSQADLARRMAAIALQRPPQMKRRGPGDQSTDQFVLLKKRSLQTTDEQSRRPRGTSLKMT